MTFKYLLVAMVGAFFLYVLLLPRRILLRKTFVLGFVALMFLFSLNPDLATRVANFFGVGRGADFLFYVSFLVLFFITFAYYLKFRQMELQWTAIVRHMAISEAKDGGSQSLGAGTLPL
jgi:small membrane protein